MPTTAKKSPNKIVAPRFHSKKTVVVAAVLVILFLLLTLTHTYFLSDKNSPFKNRQNLLTNPPESSQLSDQGVIIGNNTGQPASDKNDIYFGPIKLKNSGYVSDQLSSYVQENSSPSSSSDQTEKESISNEISQEQFSFSDFILHPITSISDVTSSYLADYTNNGRKTTLIKLVDSVSRYYVSYNHFPLDGHQLGNSYDWVDEMVEKNEMSGVYSYVLKRTSPVSYCGSVEQTGYCFDSNGQNAIIYTQLDQSATDPICGEKSLYFLWSSEDNKVGELCMDSAPNSLSGFTFLRN